MSFRVRQYLTIYLDRYACFEVERCTEISDDIFAAAQLKDPVPWRGILAGLRDHLRSGMEKPCKPPQLSNVT